MFTKPKSWLSGGLWKPKNPHSLEHLKYLYGVLCKHQIVTEQNKSLLVETLRSISEILIWGDQNDSSVFDFFLEKNMLSFFLRFMRQKSGRYICVQLLQTLNILFENISNETSVYYLLSNNHINSIIVHKFDFSDEEVMAYYISFLKTLSLKLNKHTIHFFYNEHTNDFALYTEAIKFFNQSESMVRIAVRTITLNVYKVDDKSMLRYIRDKTAAPYFSNLVWFIGNHIIELDSCVRNDADHNSRDRLADLVAEHLDHLHYLNDILCLRIDALNEVLTDHLLNRLLLPLYVYSLTKRSKYSTRVETKPHVNSVVSLFLLSQVFLIISHSPLVRQLADIILNGDLDICTDNGQPSNSPIPNGSHYRGFVQPPEPLAQSLENVRGRRSKRKKKRPNYTEESATTQEESSTQKDESKDSGQEAQETEEKESLESTKRDEETDESENKQEAESEKAKDESVAHEVSTDESKQPEVSTNQGESDNETKDDSVSQEESGLEMSHNETVVSYEESGMSQEDVLREESASPDLQDIDTYSECSVATTTEPEGEDDYSTASASPFPTEEVQEAQDTQETKDTQEQADTEVVAGQNSTDEEKLMSAAMVSAEDQPEFTLNNRPYLEAIFSALDCQESDYEALFALCLLYAMGHNEGINQELLDTAFMPTDKSATKDYYNITLVEKLIHIISMSCETNSRIRLATLEMSILLLKQLVYRRGNNYLQDRHLAAIEGAREEGTLLLRNFYKSEEIFLDMFEDEFREMQNRPLNVEYLMMDASILLPPTGTPLTGIDFNKRLPCGEVERARRAIRVFFLLRDLSLTLRQEPEYQLPLTKQEECVKVADVLDLNNSDLIACTVITRDSKKERRFLVIDVLQLILVEPDTRRLGWGVVKFVGLLQDVEVTGDKDDSRSLHITIHKPSMNVHARPLPLLSAKFVFDDHIRCMAAKQRLTKGRLKARQRKMQMIARLLELPSSVVESMYQPSSFVQSAAALRTGQSAIPGRSHMVRKSSDVHRREGARERSGGTVQRQTTHPVPIRHPRSIAVRQSKSRPMPMMVSDDSIEQAEEATPSPEAHAIQSLNNRGVHATASYSDIQEIQMRDLSQKPKVGVTAADLLKRRSSSPSSRGRSASQSPNRGRGISSSPSRRTASKDRKDGTQRSGSHPSPRVIRKDDGHSVTSFTQEKERVEERRRRRSSSGSSGQPCPKTLAPATEPITSLLDTSTNNSNDVPKLLPPAEPQRIRSFSDTSSMDSEASTDIPKTDMLKTLESKGIPSIMMESLPYIDTSPSEYKDAIAGTSKLMTDDMKVNEIKQDSPDTEQVKKDNSQGKLPRHNSTPFKLSESPPLVDINKTTVQPDHTGADEVSVTEDLSRLAEASVSTYTANNEPGSIELSNNVTQSNISAKPSDS